MKTIIRIFLICAGAVCFLWFFLPGSITANFHIGVLTGAGIGLVLFLYGLFFTLVNRFIGWLWKHIAGKILIIAVTCVLCTIMALAGACIYHMVRACHTIHGTAISDASGETQHDLGDTLQSSGASSPTILVLGCKVYSYGPSLSLIARMDAALDYLSSHPDAACIVCGGQGPGEPCTEAQAMYDYMTEKGLSASRIFTEDASTDTKENLANAARIINEQGLSDQTVIATNDFHMYRALAYAEDVGLSQPGAVPAPTLWWLFPSLSVREMYGIMEMWVLN